MNVKKLKKKLRKKINYINHTTHLMEEAGPANLSKYNELFGRMIAFKYVLNKLK
jgi:hypothetical protein